MKKDAPAVDDLNRRMQCFGEFDVQDPVCRQVCALRLRCAIEFGQQERTELMEELFSGNEVRDRMH
ncbi:MAG: hypothetical protein AMJ54_09100 [Deltaproteobacteria bacterium SG8_13]|nr:MAG: hypothetical protein AMJ54_09100 [Deltaproteobacteria bacterium SG8_13]